MNESYDNKDIESIIRESSETINNSKYLIPEILDVIRAITKCIRNGNKLIIFGNGGSAADAQHIAGEFIGRFQKNRKSYPAIALTTDSSIITAISNDFTFDITFSRQCEALVSKGDVVIGISTSGNSTNVIEGLKISKNMGALTIGLLGNGGGKIKRLVDMPIIVKSSSTPRVQEAHRTIYHIICQMVEEDLES